MPTQPANHYMKGAFVLTLAAFIVKILSAAYRVPYQNIVGDIGFYIYQQVYPIYGIGMILATTGFPVIISKLAADHSTERQTSLGQRIQAAFITLTLVGVSLFVCFYFGAASLAGWMGDAQLTSLIEISSFMFLLLPVIAISRGYFQGNGDMFPTAISQVTEQAIRVAIIMAAAVILTERNYSLYEVGTFAMAGSFVGGTIGAIILLMYMSRRKALFLFTVKGLSWRGFYHTAKLVLVQGAVFCLSGMVLILFQFADSFSIYSLLTSSGVNGVEAKVLKGIFDRGQPLIQLGSVAAASFSLALVPVITTAWLKRDEKTIQTKSINAMKITLVIACGATFGLINIMKPTNTMLFSNAEGTAVLATLVIAILFNSIVLICTGILQALDHVFIVGKYILIGLIVKTAGNFIAVPLLGTLGASLSTVAGLAVMALLFVRVLQKRIPSLMAAIRNLLPPVFLAIIAMTVALQLWSMVFSLLGEGRLYDAMLSFTSVCIGLGIYLGIILKRGCLTEEELSFFPFSNKLIRFNSQRK